MKFHFSVHFGSCCRHLLGPSCADVESAGSPAPPAAAAAAPKSTAAVSSKLTRDTAKKTLWGNCGPQEPLCQALPTIKPELNFSKIGLHPCEQFKLLGSAFQAEQVLFEHFFPEPSVDKIVTATNQHLRPKRPINRDELFKFFALTLRIGLNRCPSRAENWRLDHPPLPSFSSIMAETRYEDILAAFHLCEFTDEDLKVCGACLWSFGSQQQDPWKPVSEFVKDFNSRQIQAITPSERLHVDESMSRWLGKVYDATKDLYGLPHMVSLPPPKGIGLEINVLVDAETHIILQIETQGKPEEMRARLYDEGNTEGAAICLRLTECVKQTARVIDADARFASTATAVALKTTHGLLFTGVCKSAKSDFPMKDMLTMSAAVEHAPIHQHATIKGVEVVAFGYYDRGPHTLVSTYFTSCSDKTPAAPRTMPRYREPGEEYFHYKVPNIIEHYRACNGGVDHHNLLRQELLGLERNFHTHSWWIRFFTTILSMTVVNAFLAYGYFFPSRDWKVTHLVDFTQRLCAALAGCPLSARKRKRGAAAAASSDSGPTGELPLWPPQVHHMAALKDHENFKSKSCKQVRCAECHQRSTRYCETCYSRTGKIVGLCDIICNHGECLRSHSLSAR